MFEGMKVADSIRDKLTVSFAPIALEVTDESHRHAVEVVLRIYLG